MATRLEQIRAELEVRDNASKAADAVAAAMERAAKAYEQSDQAVRKASPSFEAVNRKIDENARLTAQTTRINNQYEASVRAVNEQLAKNAISEEQAAEKIRRLAILREAATAAAQKQAESMARTFGTINDQVDSVVRQSQQAAANWRFAFFNIQDLFNQLISGGSPLVALSQQGPSIVQNLGGISNSWALLTRAVTSNPIGLAITAVVAAFGAMAAATTLSESRMGTLRNSLRTVTTDFRAAADEIERDAKRIADATPGVSRGDVRDVAVTVRRNAPANFREDLQALTNDVRDFSRTIATDFASANEMLARTLRDPMAIVREMSEQRLPGFNERLRDTVERLLATNQRAAAAQLVLEQLRNSTKGAAEDVAPLTSAWQALTKEFGVLFGTISDWLSGAGAKMLEWMASLLRLINRAVELLPQLNRRVDAGPLAPGAQYAGAGTTEFRAALANAESSGNPSVVNQYGYTGLYQFGTARLADLGLYRPASGESLQSNQWLGQVTVPGFAPMSQQEFRYNAAAQNAAFDVHLADLDRAIDRLMINGQPALSSGATIDGLPINRNGLRAVGHMYPSLLQSFISSNGRPLRPDGTPYADGNGTSPLDYFRAFSTTQAVTITTPQVQVGNPGDPPTVTLPGASVSPSMDQQEFMRLLGMGRGSIGLDLPSLSGDRRERIDYLMGRSNAALPMAADARETEALLELQRKLRQELEATKSPFDAYIENLQRSAAVAEQTTPAQQELTRALQDFEQSMARAGVVVTDQMRSQVQAEVLRNLNAEYRKAGDEIDRSITAQDRLQAAYQGGSAAVAEATAREQALEVVRRSGITGANEQAAAIDALAGKYRTLAREQQASVSAQQAMENRRQAALTGLEAGLIGASPLTRQLTMARARTAAGILGRGGNLEDPESSSLLLSVEELTRAQYETQRLQTAWDDLQRIGVQAFDRIGEAITEAFAQGKIEALDFASVGKAVISELLQAFLKFAVLNPLKNYLFGGGDTTLGSIVTVLGGGGGGGGALLSAISGGGEISGSAINIGGSSMPLLGSVLGGGISAGSTYAFGAGSSASSGGIGNLLTYGGSGLGLGARLFNFGGYNFSSIGSSLTGIGVLSRSGIGMVDDFLNTPISSMPVSAGESAFRSAAGLSSAPQYTLGNAIGGVAGVAGGAYGIYSGIQKGGIGGGITAAGGAVSAGLGAASLAAGAGLLNPGTMAALGSLGPYGWIAAAVLAVVGALLPGAKPSNMEGNARIDLSSGEVVVDGQTGKKYSQANRDAARSMTDQVYDLVLQVSQRLGASGMSGGFTIGVGNRDGIYYNYMGNSRHEFSRTDEGAKALTRELVERITMSNLLGLSEVVERARAGIRWDSLENALTDISSIAAVTNNGRPTANQTIAARTLNFAGNLQGSLEELAWVKDVYEPLVNGGINDRLSSFRQQLKALDEEWMPLIERTERLGLSSKVLRDTLQSLKDEIVATNDLAIRSTTGGFRVRALRAGNLSNDPAVAQQADLLAFDLRAEQERLDYNARMRTLAATAEQTAEGLTVLGEALALERNAIIAGYQDIKKQQEQQRAATAAGLIGSIGDYATSLRIGDLSPLSDQAKYGQARSNFDSVLKRAIAGDPDALANSTSAISEFLAASRSINGSGAAYVADYNQSLAYLESIGNLSPDTLTQQIYVQEQRDTRDVLKEELQRLREEVVALRREVAMNNLAPQR